MSESGGDQTGGRVSLEWIKTGSEVDHLKAPHETIEFEHSADGRFSIVRNGGSYGLHFSLHDSHLHATADFGLIRQAEERADEIANGIHPGGSGAADTGELKWTSSASMWERMKTREAEVEVEHTTDGRFGINRTHYESMQASYFEFISHDKITHRTSERFRSLKEARAWAEDVRSKTTGR